MWRFFSGWIETLPGDAAFEVVLWVMAVILLPRLLAMVREATGNSLLPPTVAMIIEIAFGVGLPAALVVWFASIPFRYP